MTLEKLRKYCQDNKAKDISIVVGFSQKYALEVHERTDIKHKVGQSKYLETAARTSEPEVKNILANSPRSKLAENMLKCALLIQRRAQELTPVDTSALKASAFVSVEEDLDSISQESRTKAEIIRTTVLAKRAQGQSK